MDKSSTPDADSQDIFTAIKKCDIRKLTGFLIRGGDPSMLYLPDGISPMHLAAGIRGAHALEVVKLLLVSGGNPNVSSFEGLTPVHISAAWGCHQTLRLLLKYGGDMHIQDDEGYDAKDFARNNSQRKTLLILEEKEKEVARDTHKEIASTLGTAKNCPAEKASHSKSVKDLVNRLSQTSLEPSCSNDSVRTELCTVNWNPAKIEEISGSKLVTKASVQNDLRSDVGSNQSWYTVDEYLYLNDKENVALIEKHWIAGESFENISDGSFHTVDAGSVWCVNSLESTRPNSISDSILELDDKELVTQLKRYNDTPGPITPTTRRVYLRRLFKLRQGIVEVPKNPTQKYETVLYSRQLMDIINGKQDIGAWSNMESKFLKEFSNVQPNQCWRGGLNRSFFNYLLLDPRITQNLPLRASKLSLSQCFSQFVKSIFYVGKGKNARSYDHFCDALKSLKNSSVKKSKKITRILDIWNAGFGVVSLHCFHCSLAAEAFTVEACMIEALKLSNLTNLKHGELHGQVKLWTSNDKCRIGTIFLFRALQIFLQEEFKSEKYCTLALSFEQVATNEKSFIN